MARSVLDSRAVPSPRARSEGFKPTDITVV